LTETVLLPKEPIRSHFCVPYHEMGSMF